MFSPSSQASCPRPHSHSMVPGGLEVTSYTTRLTVRTVLQMRVDTARRKAGSNGYQSAVMPSAEQTARSATTWLCVRWSPCTPTDLHGEGGLRGHPTARTQCMHAMELGQPGAWQLTYVQPVVPHLTGRNTANACQILSYRPQSRMVCTKTSSTWRSTSSASPSVTSPSTLTASPGPASGARHLSLLLPACWDRDSGLPPAQRSLGPRAGAVQHEQGRARPGTWEGMSSDESLRHVQGR